MVTVNSKSPQACDSVFRTVHLVYTSKKEVLLNERRNGNAGA